MSYGKGSEEDDGSWREAADAHDRGYRSAVLQFELTVKTLQAELAEARKDEARYRYLRDSRSALAITLFHRREPEEWDSEIDAAIAATKGG